ncbi:MAG: MBL fold metallo-hydrolase [Clostridia bacterium]|nr:MBL fold metallo-hydrolase [Clostridia bacterium]
MNIKTMTLGLMGVNCYILTDSGEAAVIDPGAECEKITDYLNESGCALKKILLTHGHFDHIGALCDLAEETGAKVYVHSGDSKMLTDNGANLSFMTGERIKPYEADVLLDDITEIPLGNTVIKVLHTPGHSSGSVSYLWGDNIFCGDLLFRGSIGRYDFGNLTQELRSIRFLTDTLDDSVKVFPGHGESTTIGFENNNNPYSIHWND